MARTKASQASAGRLLLSCLALFPSSLVKGYTVESASFGQSGEIAPEGSLKNWYLSGKDYTPDILSNKIILTPVYPGHKQGAAWTQNTLTSSEFLVDFEFRATGPENGQGQLQLWYTRENNAQIGSKNLYGVGKFTGLALLIDQLGGRGGGIRAFLNDGNIDYSKSNIEQLPFGHCDYSYRNLGRPSKLQMHQDTTGLEVLIDGRRCFKAENVFLPAGNYFGLTGNTGETPDSFELFKFVTQTGLSVAREEPVRQQQAPMGGAPEDRVHQHQQNQQPAGGVQGQRPMAQPPPPKVGGTADSPMLNDIHSHVLALGNYLPSGVGEIKQKLDDLLSAGAIAGAAGAAAGGAGGAAGPYATKADLHALEQKLDRVTILLEKVASEQRDWSGHFQEINREIKAGSTAFMDKLPESMGKAITTHGPSTAQMLFILIAAQLVLGLGYVVYKRRESSPKKYL